MDSIKADVTGAADQGGTGLMKASSPVSRRTVVATGVAAAWTIPVIQLATAAPALAASTPTTTLVWGGFSAAYPNGDGGHLRVTGQVTDSGAAAASGVIVNLIFPVGLATNAVPNPPANWTVTRSSDGKTWTLTLNSSLGAGASAPIDITFTMPDTSGNAFSLNATAQAGNAKVVATSASVVATTTLSWTSLTASYPNGDASQLIVAATVAADAKAAALTPVITLTLDPTLAGASALPVSRWSAVQNGNFFTFTRSADLPAGTSDTLNVTFTTGNTTGKGFTLNGKASSSNAPASDRGATVDPVATLTLSGATAAYGSNGADAGTLAFSATVGNAGSATTTGAQLKVTLPAGASAPTAPTGWTLTSNTATDFVFTKQQQLVAGDSKSFSVTFTMGSRDGNAGTVTAVLSATNTVSRTATATLAATPNDTLKINGLAASATTGQQKTIGISGLAVQASGGTNTGAVTVLITIPSSVGTPSGVSGVADGWGKAAAIGQAANGDSTVTFISTAGLTPANLTSTPSTPTLSATISIPNSAKNQTIKADASASHANPAQQATAKAF